MGLGRQMYEKCPVGQTAKAYPARAVIKGASGDDEADPGFVAIVEELDALETEGLIEIIERHRESETGKNYVDLVEYRRLK